MAQKLYKIRRDNRVDAVESDRPRYYIVDAQTGDVFGVQRWHTYTRAFDYACSVGLALTR